MKTMIIKSKCRNCGKIKTMDIDLDGAGNFEANHPYWKGSFYGIFASGDRLSCPAPFVFLDQCDCSEGEFILHDVISYKVK